LTEPTALSVVYLPIENLIPYARNSRTHSPAQIAQIAGSIREFSFTNPVLVDGDGNVIAGHGRILAARQLGMQAVPCIRLGHLTEPQRKALIIADNKLALNAGWNDELLSLELRDLADGGFDLGLTGFSGDELADLLADRTEGLTDPDDAPPAPVNPVSVLGDVWLLGKHRIVCGDCTDADVVARCLDGAKPHLMVTDPPYGVEYDPAWRGAVLKDGANRATGQVRNDDRADWREAWALFPGVVAYIWHADRFVRDVADSLASCRFKLRAQIVWVKTRHTFGRGHYHSQHEPCLYAVQDGADDCWQADHEIAAYAVKDGNAAAWRGGRKQSTVWFIEHIKSDTGHGTQKPVECMRRPIENNSAPGQEVYEPFSGSGTTIIACEMTGRSARAIELNPAYVDVAVKRWQDFTGQTATLEATGAAFADVCEQRYAGGEWAANCAGSYDDAVSAARSALEAAE
jgi:DNA modification methylase